MTLCSSSKTDYRQVDKWINKIIAHSVMCKEITKHCNWVVIEDFPEGVIFGLSLEGCKEARYMRNQGRYSPKDQIVSVKILREKVKLERLEKQVGSKLR